MTRCRAALAVLCLACASAPEAKPLTAEEQKDPVAVPTFLTLLECQQMWSRAQIWVSKNSDYKVQLATDTLIQTYVPLADAGVAATVTKMPLADTPGALGIAVALNCRKQMSSDAPFALVLKYCPVLKPYLLTVVGWSRLWRRDRRPR